ncbi:MAG: cytochrome b561 domain-containing protein [Pseudolabrys sp.]|nr:cytochrome b561 domain-containing protein [Pseudolabrys sp.]
MNALPSHIPTEVHFEFLGATIPIHWNYHAILMVGVWIVLVPLCIITIRYGKPKPTLNGIREQVRLKNAVWWWFSVHKFGLYLAVVLSLAGLAAAVTVSRGFSGSVHAIFGIMTIVLGCLQVISGLLRGTHGGRNYHTAVPDDPSTWRGDHYDMTPRRRKFEAYHRTAGYFAGFFAVGAVASGLMQYPMPVLGTAILIFALFVLLLCIALEYKGLRYDGYRAAHGYNPEHPYNKERKNL